MIKLLLNDLQKSVDFKRSIICFLGKVFLRKSTFLVILGFVQDILCVERVCRKLNRNISEPSVVCDETNYLSFHLFSFRLHAARGLFFCNCQLMCCVL